MRDFTYPSSIPFPWGRTFEDRALKVVEEAAELVEAVKHGTRDEVLDEAMDVYQAVVNVEGLVPTSFRIPDEPTLPTKGSALSVLEEAALMLGWPSSPYGPCNTLLWRLACLLADTYGPGEVEAAYDRCVARNAARGRYDDLA